MKVYLSLSCQCLILLFFVKLNAQIDSVQVIYNWDDPTIPVSSTVGNAYNETYGFVVNDHEFAAIGSTLGTHIFALDNDPIEYVSFIEGSASGAVVVVRDYDYHDGYLYTVADNDAGQSALQIIDVSSLPDTSFVAAELDEEFTTAHNIVIDESSELLYVCGGFYFFTGLFNMRVYDISDPLNLQLVYNYPDHYVHDVYVKNDTAFMHCGDAGMFIYNFANPADPELIGQLISYPDQGYNHSGWPSEDGSHYYMTDETFGKQMKALNIEDFMDIQVSSLFGPDSSIFDVVHNPMVRGNYLFCAYYYDGLLVYDLTDPGNPELIRSFASSSLQPEYNFAGAFGVYALLPSGKILLSDMQNGLFVLDTNLGFETFIDTMAVDTMIVDTMLIDTMMIDTMMVDTMDIDTMQEDTLNSSIIEFDLFEGLELYPTLVSNRIFIKSRNDAWDQKIRFDEIRLLDLNGKILKSEKIDSSHARSPFEWEIPSFLKPGLYFIEILQSNNRKVFKILKREN